MIRRPPRSTQGVSSAASDVYKRQSQQCPWYTFFLMRYRRLPSVASFRFPTCGLLLLLLLPLLVPLFDVAAIVAPGRFAPCVPSCLPAVAAGAVVCACATPRWYPALSLTEKEDGSCCATMLRLLPASISTGAKGTTVCGRIRGRWPFLFCRKGKQGVSERGTDTRKEI